MSENVASSPPALKSSLPSALAVMLTSVATAVAAPPDVLTESESVARAKRVSKVELELRLEFEPKAEGYRGAASIGFQLGGADQDLRLDLRCDKIARLSVNGSAVGTATFDGNRLMLPAGALAVGLNKVEIEYESAYERSGNGLHYFLDPADQNEYLYTNFEPFTAHRLIPCFDQPDLKTVMKLVVTAPKDWRIIGNTTAKAVRVDGKTSRHEFQPTPRISTYLLFLAAGPYELFVDEKARIPSRIFARKTMAKHVDKDEIFLITRQGLDFFEKYYGVPYPFGKYDQLFVPEFIPGAMENPAAVTFNERSLFRHKPTTRERQGRAETILHEMAHMWFGDLVTMRWWDGLWLNESFATYMAALAATQATEFKDSFEEFLSGEKSWAYWQDQLPTTHPINCKVPDTDTAFSNFDGITYGKGAAMLKQLAYYVGPENFRKGVRAYFEKHAWKNTELEDFFAAMSGAYGKDLSGWADIHLETAGVNTLVPRIELEGGKIASLELEQQEGNGDRKLRPQRLVVALYKDDGKGGLQSLKQIPVAIEGARTAVPEAKGLEAPAFVWANHGDHAYLRCFLDPVSLEYARKNLEDLPDGLTRRGVWMTLWEMTREGQLAASRMLDIFSEKAPLENDVKIQQGLFRGVNQALNHYLEGEEQKTYFAKIHALSWQQLEKAAPGSDMQKEWFVLATDTAGAPADLEKLEALLDGKKKLEKFEIDPEKRWRIVARLCAFDRPGARKRLEEALKLDDTDIGRREALKAEASFPDPKVKESVWKRVQEDEKTSLGALRSAMAGFHWTHQSDLSRPYIDRFFSAIPRVRSSRDQEFAYSFVETMFPANVHDRKVLDESERFLKSHGELPADLKKALLNANDELARCLRLRQAH